MKIIETIGNACSGHYAMLNWIIEALGYKNMEI